MTVTPIGRCREVNGLAADRELPRIGVEHAFPESNPHRRSQKNPRNFKCFSNDFLKVAAF